MKGNEMKNLDKILFVAVFAAISSMAGQASAQYQATGADGITASPKLRQQLSERTRVPSGTSMTVATVGYRAAGEDGIAASPKLREFIDQRKAVAPAPGAVVASAGYRATGVDGITASPKLRQQLDERVLQPTMIAPLK